MLLQDLLRESARRRPAKAALICGGSQVTYAELDQQANRLAHALIESGLARGDRVAIYLDNCVETVVSIMATLRAGGVFVPVNPLVKADKLAAILNHCQAAAAVVRPLAHRPPEKTLARIPSLKFMVACGPSASRAGHDYKEWLHFDHIQSTFSAQEPPCSSIDLDLACLIYTSGSTGDPKGVMCDHSAMLFATETIAGYLNHSENDVILSVLPVSFSYGLYQLLTAFHAGATVVLENSFAYPSQILQRMAEQKATGFPGVPTIYSMLVQMDLSSYDLSHLRYMTNAAAALSPSHIRALRRKLPWVDFYSMHGLTEVVRTIFLPPDLADIKPDSVGRAMPGTEVWIEDEAGRRLGPGETGELVVRGRHVMRGYWNDPEGTARRFRAGSIPGERLCYSGDLFRMDKEGCFYFVSRKDDIIKCRGEKVSPREVENTLYRLESVAEAAVVGVPDPVLGQTIKAVIVPRGNSLTAAQVLAHCRAHLEDYMIPRQIEFRDELPKTLSGKIKRANL